MKAGHQKIVGAQYSSGDSRTYNIAQNGGESNFASNTLPINLRDRQDGAEMRFVDGDLSNLNPNNKISALRSENDTLKLSNERLQSSITELNRKLLELRTKPSQIKISPALDTSNMVTRLESEIGRLKTQLEQKTEQNADLRLQLKRKQETPNLDSIKRQLREEIRMEVEESNMPLIASLRERALHGEQELDLVTRDLQEKEREINSLEARLQELEDREIEKMEELRKTIADKLWKEYEEKLHNKQEEYEKRVQNGFSESEDLTKTLTDWRARYAQLEEKNCQLIDELNQVTQEEVDKRKIISDYEQRKEELEFVIEKLRRQLSEAEESNIAIKDRSNLLEKYNADIEAKIIAIEEKGMNARAENTALIREVDRREREISIWKKNVERLEGVVASKNMEINELTKIIELKGIELGVLGGELDREKGESVEIAKQLYSTESTSKMQADNQHSLESKIAQLESERNNYIDQLRLATESCKKWKDQYEIATTNSTSDNQQLRNFNKELSEENAELRAKSSDYDHLSEEYMHLKKDHNLLTQRLRKVEQDLRHAYSEITLLKQRSNQADELGRESNSSTSNFKGKYERLKVESEKLLSANEALRKKLSSIEDASLDTEAELERCKKKCDQLIRDLSKVNGELKIARANELAGRDLEYSTRTAFDEANKVKEQMINLKEELMEARARVRELEVASSIKDRLEKDYSSMKDGLSLKDKEISVLQGKIDNLNYENSVLKQDCRNLAECIRSYEEAEDNRNDELEEFRSQVTENESQLIAEIERLRSENDTLRADTEDLENQNRILESDIMQLRNKLDESEKVMGAKESNTEQANELCKALRVELDKSNGSLQKAEQASNELRGECQHLKNKIIDLEGKLRNPESAQQLQILEEDNHHLASELHSLKQIADEQMREIRALEAERNDFEASYADAFQKYQVRLQEVQQLQSRITYIEQEHSSRLRAFEANNNVDVEKIKLKILEDERARTHKR